MNLKSYLEQIYHKMSTKVTREFYITIWENITDYLYLS